jgi:hypothetical protein
MFKDFQKRENRILKINQKIGFFKKIGKYLKSAKNFKLIF